MTVTPKPEVLPFCTKDTVGNMPNSVSDISAMMRGYKTVSGGFRLYGVRL